MAKRGRPRIHPPKIPKGERAKVTIANQEKQIKLLIDRSVLLEDKLEDARKQIEALEESFTGQFEMNSNLTKQLCDIQEAYKRMEGWRDCAKEIIEQLIDK